MNKQTCHVDMAIVSTTTTRRYELLAGTEVDLDRELEPGLTMAAAIQGRETCFSPVAPPPPPVSTARRTVAAAATTEEKE